MPRQNHRKTKRAVTILILLSFMALNRTVSGYQDEKNGFYRTFYADGTLESETFYRDGEKEGTHKLYNENGTLFSETRYRKNQRIYEKTRDQTGNTAERYLNNGRITHAKVCNGQGKVVEEESFKKGLKEGAQKKSYPDGNTRIISPYAKGLKHGTEKQYYHNGQIQTACQYNNGARHGHSKTFDNEGNLKTDQIFINGRLQRQKS